MEMICNDPVYRDKCKAENVKVTCGLVDIGVNRNRREAGHLFCCCCLFLCLSVLFLCVCMFGDVPSFDDALYIVGSLIHQQIYP